MPYPNYITADQACTRFYTANFDSTVSTVDVATAAPIGTVQFPSHLDGGDRDYTFWDIAINPMGKRLYVLNTIYQTTLPAYTLLGNTVEVTDTENNAVIASVPLGLESQPSDIVVDPTGARGGQFAVSCYPCCTTSVKEGRDEIGGTLRALSRALKRIGEGGKGNAGLPQDPLFEFLKYRS